MSMILITGHPRCGTGYMSKLAQSFGLSIGHETLESDGLSSWLMAPNNGFVGFNGQPMNRQHFDHVICVARNPFNAIPSIYYTEKPSLFYRCNRCEDLRISKGKDSSLFTSVVSYITWYEMILEQEVNLTVRVETSYNELYEWLVGKGFNVSLGKNPSNKTNSREHPDISKSLIMKKSGPFLNRLIKLCDRFGYKI